jgi:hypothetical protein
MLASSVANDTRTRHPAVLLLAQLATVLPRDPYGMSTLLGKPGVIDDP